MQFLMLTSPFARANEAVESREVDVAVTRSDSNDLRHHQHLHITLSG